MAAAQRSRTILRLAILAAVLTIGLTGVTFWLSYEALHTLAAANGLQGERAWAWPATIDAFIVIGEVLILRASLLRRVDWLAVILTASGSIGSIVLNVASAGQVDRMTQVVHAVPPCAALLIFTALMRQIYRALSAATVEQLPAAPPMPQQAPTVPAVEDREDFAPEAKADEEQQQPEEKRPERPAIQYTDPRCAVIRALYEDGYRPTTGEMKAALLAAGHTAPSPSGLRGVLRSEVEQREPHLAALPSRPSPLHRAG